MLSGFITLTAYAEEENFIAEGSATFEEGESVWSALGGGNVKVTNNPTGEGKVLCYSGIPDKSYASPQIDVRPFILNNVTEETTVYCSIDIYTKNADIVGALIRLRTATADGYSGCTAQGKNYCTIGKADASEDEWSRVTFSMEITEADLTSTEPWNICFDGLSSNTREAIYFDNFYIGLEEDCP